MNEQLTNRDHLMYLFGSVLVAAVLSIGGGLLFGAGWKPVLGSTMVMALLLYAWTLVRVAERKPTEEIQRETVAVNALKEAFALLNPSGANDNTALHAMVVIEKAMQQLGWHLNYETEAWEQS